MNNQKNRLIRLTTTYDYYGMETVPIQDNNQSRGFITSLIRSMCLINLAITILRAIRRGLDFIRKLMKRQMFTTNMFHRLFITTRAIPMRRLIMPMAMSMCQIIFHLWFIIRPLMMVMVMLEATLTLVAMLIHQEEAIQMGEFQIMVTHHNHI